MWKVNWYSSFAQAQGFFIPSCTLINDQQTKRSSPWLAWAFLLRGLRPDGNAIPNPALEPSRKHSRAMSATSDGPKTPHSNAQFTDKMPSNKSLNQSLHSSPFSRADMRHCMFYEGTLCLRARSRTEALRQYDIPTSASRRH